MTNSEIIQTETALLGFVYTGENLFTFQEWKKRGYSVIKGEKAFLKTKLWQPVTKKNEEGKKENKMIMVNANLFTADQVKKVD